MSTLINLKNYSNELSVKSETVNYTVPVIQIDTP